MIVLRVSEKLNETLVAVLRVSGYRDIIDSSEGRGGVPPSRKAKEAIYDRFERVSAGRLK